ncbi:hypothetical protein [Bradyrhizobium elkanii]|uniref:hypothetical protein n=1 Tax=Bradyrhizobium elkanii TaxID=29448 RepID=UPI000483FDCF|nr:hypothetical protein [Bradyrhizobium elkanii]
MQRRWSLSNFLGAVYLARLWRLLRNLWPWGHTVQFALIFPARMDHNSVLPPNGGDAYVCGAIANVGTVPFNPLLLQVSAEIGNNNLPGPGPATVWVSLKILGPTVLLNPGEVTGSSFGLSLAAIQSAIPEVTAQTSYNYFGLFTVLRFHNGVAGVNTSVEIKYTARLGRAIAEFTTVYTNGQDPGPYQYTFTPGFTYSEEPIVALP